MGDRADVIVELTDGGAVDRFVEQMRELVAADERRRNRPAAAAARIVDEVLARHADGDDPALAAAARELLARRRRHRLFAAVSPAMAGVVREQMRFADAVARARRVVAEVDGGG